MLGIIQEYPISFLFYVTLAIFAIGCAYIAQNIKSYIPLIIVLIVLSIVSSIRAPFVGVDTYAYFYSYIGSIPTYFEPGFVLIIKATRNINSFKFFLLICSALIYVPVIYFIWKERNYINITAACMVYMLEYFTGSWNGIRSYIIVSVIFCASLCLFRKKYVLYSIIVLLMMSIHTSAVVFLLSLLLYVGINNWYETRRYLTFILLISSCALFFYYIWLNGIFDKYLIYIEPGEGQGEIGISRILLIFGLTLVIIDSVVNINKYKYCKIEVLYSCYMVLIGIILFLFSLYIPMISRVAGYFHFFSILLVGFSWKRRSLLMVFAKIILLISYIYGFCSVFYSNGQKLLPYEVLI